MIVWLMRYEGIFFFRVAHAKYLMHTQKRIAKLWDYKQIIFVHSCSSSIANRRFSDMFYFVLLHWYTPDGEKERQSRFCTGH